jgi:hypothetical protein
VKKKKIREKRNKWKKSPLHTLSDVNTGKFTETTGYSKAIEVSTQFGRLINASKICWNMQAMMATLYAIYTRKTQWNGWGACSMVIVGLMVRVTVKLSLVCLSWLSGKWSGILGKPEMRKARNMWK